MRLSSFSGFRKYPRGDEGGSKSPVVVIDRRIGSPVGSCVLAGIVLAGISRAGVARTAV